MCTPTEAAGIGVGGTFIVGAIWRKLNWRSIVSSVKEAVLIQGILGPIIVGSLAIGYSVAHLGLGSPIVKFLGGLPIPPLLFCSSSTLFTSLWVAW